MWLKTMSDLAEEDGSMDEPNLGFARRLRRPHISFGDHVEDFQDPPVFFETG